MIQCLQQLELILEQLLQRVFLVHLSLVYDFESTGNFRLNAHCLVHLAKRTCSQQFRPLVLLLDVSHFTQPSELREIEELLYLGTLSFDKLQLLSFIDAFVLG